MSIDIHWDTLVNGPDGLACAEAVRNFIHERFQQVTLPPFIRSVKVHAFDFGSIAPVIEIKDICDPLPDFYDDSDDGDDEAGDAPGGDLSKTSRERKQRSGDDETRRHEAPWNRVRAQPPIDPRLTGLARGEQLGNLLSRAPTPAIPGGTLNMNYFHLPLGPGLSGTTTPFAAVASAQFQSAWYDSNNHVGRPHTPRDRLQSISSHAASSADLDSRSQSQHESGSNANANDQRGSSSSSSSSSSRDRFSQSPNPRVREASPEDVQAVVHVHYSGDVKIELTAEILLDYPMPSFVGIPIKLTITGMTFDGVAILAYIKKRAHFCFLCPDDAMALVGAAAQHDDDDDDDAAQQQDGPPGDACAATNQQHPQLTAPTGGLLEEIKVESEIGRKEHGKQVLKNVGKVENFILEHVRRIFEDELVYPSFWTFLV